IHTLPHLLNDAHPYVEGFASCWSIVEAAKPIGQKARWIEPSDRFALLIRHNDCQYPMAIGSLRPRPGRDIPAGGECRSADRKDADRDSDYGSQSVRLHGSSIVPITLLSALLSNRIAFV